MSTENFIQIKGKIISLTKEEKKEVNEAIQMGFYAFVDSVNVKRCEDGWFYVRVFRFGFLDDENFESDFEMPVGPVTSGWLSKLRKINGKLMLKTLDPTGHSGDPY